MNGCVCGEGRQTDAAGLAALLARFGLGAVQAELVPKLAGLGVRGAEVEPWKGGERDPTFAPMRKQRAITRRPLLLPGVVRENHAAA
jgi:hypothetical protein